MLLTVFEVVFFPMLSFSLAAADLRDLDDSVEFEYNRSKTEGPSRGTEWLGRVDMVYCSEQDLLDQKGLLGLKEKSFADPFVMCVVSSLDALEKEILRF